MPRRKQEESKQVNVRLPISTLGIMLKECKERNISQSDYLSERITQHAKMHRKNDGLQIATLKSLHTLKSLLTSQEIDLIERRSEAQKMFDHLYETFFAEMPNSENADVCVATDGNI